MLQILKCFWKKEAFNIFGEKVLICETKSNLEQVGILNLDTRNKFNFFTIENYVNKDKTVEQVLNVFLEKQNENLKEIVATEKEAVIFYIIDYLEGKLFRPYFRPQGRIIVE